MEDFYFAVIPSIEGDVKTRFSVHPIFLHRASQLRPVGSVHRRSRRVGESMMLSNQASEPTAWMQSVRGD